MVVEPRRAIQRHEFVVLLGEACDLAIGVVDAGGEAGGVEITDAGEMPGVARAAREGDGFMGGSVAGKTPGAGGRMRGLAGITHPCMKRAFFPERPETRTEDPEPNTVPALCARWAWLRAGWAKRLINWGE